MANNQQIRTFERALTKVVANSMRTIPRAVAKIAEDHFKENFRRGGFVDGGLKKWADVKRRDSSSPWYGFEYKGERRTSYRYSRDRTTGKTHKSKNQKRLNFSPTATSRGVLTSKRNYLMNSTKGKVKNGSAWVVNSAPHAKIHNEGGTFKVFGKVRATMPKRQFVGQSKELNKLVEAEVTRTINNLFKTI